MSPSKRQRNKKLHFPCRAEKVVCFLFFWVIAVYFLTANQQYFKDGLSIWFIKITVLFGVCKECSFIKEVHILFYSTPKGYANPAWAKAGQDLRRFADEFMRSKERKKVKQRAKRVRLQYIRSVLRIWYIQSALCCFIIVLNHGLYIAYMYKSDMLPDTMVKHAYQQ